MNLKKIVSVFCTVIMLFSVISTPVAVVANTSTGEIAYLLYDEFGENDTNGWSGRASTGEPQNGLKTELVAGSSDNYMLTYSASSNWAKESLTKSLSTPAGFSPDKDVIIEVRMKNAGSGRAFMKYNLAGKSMIDDERESGWGMLLVNEAGNVTVANGWTITSGGYYNYYNGLWDGKPNANVVTGARGDWYTYKIVIHGGVINKDNHTATGNTADFYITKPDGSVVTKTGMSLDFPDGSSWPWGASGMNWVEDALNSLDFRFRDGGSITAAPSSVINIDYVKVYETVNDVKLSAQASYAKDEPVKVTFNVGADALKNAVAIFDKDGNKVDTVNTVGEDKMSVILTPVSNLTDGERYTVKLVPGLTPQNYTITDWQREFVVSDTRYFVYDEFGEGNTNGWVAKAFANMSPTHSAVVEAVEGDDGNYALKYTANKNNPRGAYLSKVLATPVAFSQDNGVVIEVRMKQPTTSVVDLKYNLDGINYYSQEWMYGWGLLAENRLGTVLVPNGWTASENVYTEPFDVNSPAEENILKSGVADGWYTYKIVIQGGINSSNHTSTGNIADYYVYDENGTEIAKKEGRSIDFPDNSTWGSGEDSQKSGINWIEDALNSIDFRFKKDSAADDATLYIDYVKVYEIIFKRPIASDVKIDGRVAEGNSIVADYEYSSEEEKEEGISIYEWYMADNPAGEWTKIENESFLELEVSGELAGKYIKFKVTPADVSGIKGATKESNVIAPERAPVISGLELSTNEPFTKSQLEVNYVYSDENGDEETNSEIAWFESDTVSGPWNQIGTGKKLYITDAQLDKYIRCTVVPVNGAVNLGRGLEYEVVSENKVIDFVTATNLFVNGGLESGQLTPWQATTSNTSYKGISLVTDEEGIYSGNYAMRANPRINSSSDGFNQRVSLEGKKVYIISAMVKSATIDNWGSVEPYPWAGSVYRPYRESEYTSVSSEWKRSTLTVVSINPSDIVVGWLSFSQPTADFYMDDAYLGELLISDIVTNQPEPVTIPKNGDKSVKVPVLTSKKGIILNQFGETDGLTGQTAILSVPETRGVTIKDNELYIDSDASAGTVTVTVKCIPEFKFNVNSDSGVKVYEGIPAQNEFVKTVEIELVAHNEKTPVAKNVNASGVVGAGNTLNGSYEFYQVDNKEDASDVQWMYSDTENGTYYEIPGATSSSYVVESEYADKYIKFAVTPKTTDGLVGSRVPSDWLLKPTAPIAKNVSVGGDFKVGGTVKCSYEYYDANKDEEGETTFKWYVSDAQNGVFTEIPDATSEELVLTESLIDKYIKVGVTPVTDVVPTTGEEAESRAYLGPVAPVAKDVSITFENNLLVGNYTYYHEYNAKELGTAYKWEVDGITVSTKPSYVVNFSGTKRVTFTVTPVGDTNPAKGKSVSVSASVTGNAGNAGGNSVVGGFAGGGGGGSSVGGSSGGGGGSSGGVSSSSGVGLTSINNMEIPQPEKEEETTSQTDIDAHWGYDYIKEMETRGVMSADENGNFEPDKLVSRQDMITYLFKALKLENSEYSGMFSDVSDGEFAGMLQTMVDNGTISKDTTFRPNDSISREEMCKILYISLENAGKLGETEEGLINSFSDYSEVSDWAVKYVNAIYGKKIMIGVSEERFAPKENLTKAQAATLLVRILALTEEAE